LTKRRMSYSIIKPFLCCLFVALSCASLSEVENGYMTGRSANFIIKPENIQDDSFVILHDGFSDKSYDVNEIEDTDFAGLISHAVGGPLLSSQISPFSENINLFQKSSLNVLFTIDGVGSEANKKDSPLHRKLRIVKTSYPQDEISTLTTLLTGVTPSVHGIVGKLWRDIDGEYIAFNSHATPLSASVVDIISQNSQGRSLTISASGDFQLASACAVHQYFASQNNMWNNVGFFFNQDEDKFESLFSTSVPSLETNKSALMKRFVSHGDLYHYDQATKIAVVTWNGQKVSFDIEKSADSLFFLEIEYLFHLLNQMENNEYLHSLAIDSNPDLFSFAFSSVKALKWSYGHQSKQIPAAISVIDKVVHQAIDRLKTLYNSKITSEIIFLGTPAFELTRRNFKAGGDVFDILFMDVRGYNFFFKYWPNIYTYRDVSHQCQKIKNVTMSYNLETFCEDEIPYSVYDLFLRGGNITNGSNTTNNNSNNAASFQIILWVSIILVLTLFGTIWGILNMEVGADSILYRLSGYKSHQP